MFAPYFKYCAEQTACQQYCKDQDRDNQIFKAYLAVSSRGPAADIHLISTFSGARLKEIAIV